MAEKKKNLLQRYRSWKGRPRLASRFGTWRKKRGEAKNRNQLKRYSERSEALSKIKNPNDWEKNQLAHAKSMVEKASKPIRKKLAYSKNEEESIKKRQNVRKNPVSDETLAEVRRQLAKNKAKEKPTSTPTPKTNTQPNKEKVKVEKKVEKKDDGGRAAWLEKTRNSPAAKAGFSKDERWALQQKHRKWKASRGKK
tara:strand:- start:835 stop:1422 length:588 start_codon:yes stop_codon:yes gene_type:complete